MESTNNVRFLVLQLFEKPELSKKRNQYKQPEIAYIREQRENKNEDSD